MSFSKLRLLLVVAILVSSGALVTAQDSVDGRDSHFSAKDLSVSAGGGYGTGSLSAFPGAEFTIASGRIADVFPLAFGVAAKGVLPFSSTQIGFGVGAFGIAHVGLKGLDIPEFLQPVDFYLAVGPALMLYPAVRLQWLNGYLGLNYFLSDALAIYVEAVPILYYSTSIGVTLKL